MWFVIALFASAASAWVPADTSAATRAGTVTITGQPGRAMHTHGGAAESAMQVVVAPATTRAIDVGFVAVEAYYTWCNRYAFEVTFEVDGEPVVAIAETTVTRVEPMRPR